MDDLTDSRPCPVCGATSNVSFLRRSQVPAHQNALFGTEVAARHINRGDLHLLACTRCGFVFNGAFEPFKLDYGGAYDNTQSYSETFNAYLDGLVNEMIYRRAVQDSRIVEVGCGKGGFLRKLVCASGAFNTGHGYDPNYEGPETDCNGRLMFHREFFGSSTEHVAGDVVVCRHVIEHIPDPVTFLSAVITAVSESPGAKLFFETPDVEWILKEGAIWDFFYEHCSYFSVESIRVAMGLAGLQAVRIERVFGGQYLFVEARPRAELRDTAKGASTVPQSALKFGRSEERILRRLRARLITIAAEGKVVVWGAGAKGVTFLNLVDPGARVVTRVIDVNPNKHGRFLAGTGHRIEGPEIGLREDIRTIIVMNQNYVGEVRRMLDSNHKKAVVLELESMVNEADD
jgi:Methyltransferase domain/C-methyltransferase C-terminal domain